MTKNNNNGGKGKKPKRNPQKWPVTFMQMVLSEFRINWTHEAVSQKWTNFSDEDFRVFCVPAGKQPFHKRLKASVRQAGYRSAFHLDEELLLNTKAMSNWTNAKTLSEFFDLYRASNHLPNIVTFDWWESYMDLEILDPDELYYTSLKYSYLLGIVLGLKDRIDGLSYSPCTLLRWDDNLWAIFRTGLRSKRCSSDEKKSDAV